MSTVFQSNFAQNALPLESRQAPLKRMAQCIIFAIAVMPFAGAQFAARHPEVHIFVELDCADRSHMFLVNYIYI